MKKQAISLLLMLVILVTAMAVTIQAEQTLPAGGAYMVALDGTETVAEDPAAAWATGSYAYVKLYGETEAFANLDGTTLWVDLNGSDLTVGGAGTLYAFDTANDTYDAAACGTVTNTGTVAVQTDVTNPVSGYRYLALAEGNKTTFHRVELRLTAVSLRASEAGLYYKAVYNCDKTLAAKVDKYGVVLSVNNMPGADFAEEVGDINQATAVTPGENFGKETESNSGAVFGIMKQEQAALRNYYNGGIRIYANPYIRLNTADALVIVADEYNVGKTVSSPDFDGIAYSLHDTMDAIDENYYFYTKEDRTTVEDFLSAWKELGMSWSFDKIGNQKTIDNSDLDLVDGVAYCPVCEKDVTWTPITAADSGITLSDGGHYYLAEDTVTMARTSTSGAIVGPGKGKTACLHLNGKELYAEANTALYGGHGTLNVMGNGDVWSGRNQVGNGDAVHINSTQGGVVNLYGGNYTKVAGTKGHILVAATGGGTINVYEGATVAGDSSYKSIRIGTSSSSSSTSKVALYGVDLSSGSVTFDDGEAGPNKKQILELVDAKVGTVLMYDCETVELQGEAVVDNLVMTEYNRLIVNQLAPTASIGIQTPGGVFTEQTQYAAAVAAYFHPSNTYQKVTVRDGVLHCGKDFTSSAPIEEGYCPACEKSVTWTEFTSAQAGTALSAGHYYLSKDIDYTGDTASCIIGPATNQTACVHLNGNDVTSSNYYAIFSGNGVLNVMGTGTVTGYKNITGYGTAVQANNTIAGSCINLYSGIYQQAENVHSKAYTIAIQSAGGRINIYEDAEIRANVTGQAIRIRDTASAAKTGQIDLYGAKVTGDITLDGSSVSNADSSVMIIDNATVNGNVRVNGVNSFTLNNAPVIDCLYLSQETTLTLGKLTAGTDITVRADGKFSTEHSWASVFASYFTPFNTAASVTAESSILVYRVDYSKPLVFTEGTTGMCPLCETNVQWTALTANAGTMQTLSAGGHYYLASSQTFTAAADAFIEAPSSGAACLHLNDSDLSATNTVAISGNSGVLNVMGAGKVTGQTAVQTDNAAEGSAINLYSGTYTGSQSAAVSIQDAGTVNVHHGAAINAGAGNAIDLGKTTATGNAELNLNSCVITGNIVAEAAEGATGLTLNTLDVTVNGTVDIKGTDNVVTFEGKTVISQLNIAEGLLVDFVDMLEGSSIQVSAEGVFTPVIGEADHYAPYFTTGDEGDWVICRDYTLTQTEKTTALPTQDGDVEQLESLYEGRSPYYGDLHNHARNNNDSYSDGTRVLADWVTHMEENRIDFAAILNHRQTIHMYQDEWDDACFVGASEPGTTFLDGNAEGSTIDFAMTFADVAAFEEHIQSFSEFAWESTSLSGDPTNRFVSGKFTVARLVEMVKSVLSHGGFFTHVHPKLNGYMVSDDPEDYWFVDGTGIEVTTTAYGDMSAKSNVEAYELWVDLLERGHRLFATIGDDNHKLTDVTSLNTVYTTEGITAQKVVDNLRDGDLTAGPVGIRMSIGDTYTGGLTSFVDNRLVFSVGQIHELNYDSTHKYGVELYDDGGIIFSAEIDPTETTYFAMDTDSDRMFYRAVVVDLTKGVRIAVGNPIWNADLYVEQQKISE